MKLSVKLILLFSLVILLVTASMGMYSSISMKTQVAHIAEKMLVSNVAMAEALLNEKYPGDWEIRKGRLYKGNMLMEGDQSIADSVGKLTGDKLLIFKGNKSIAATADEKSGVREMGLLLEPDIEKTRLDKGETYIGESHGGEEMALYEPIKSKDGKTVGAFHTGMSMEMYDNASASFRKSLIWFALLGLAISVAISAFLSIRFIRPLLTITRLVDRVSIGELRVDELSIKSKDELGKLGQAVNGMVQGLRGLVTKVQSISVWVTSASGSVSEQTRHISEMAAEVDNAVKQVASGAEQQALGTDECAKAVEEIASSIQHIAETSSQVAFASIEMVEQAEQGNESIRTAVQEIQQLDATTRQLAVKIEGLSQSSENIGSIATVITEIAAQTNLLALNAAIEAARAGEQGRGFTVVAGEVKKLAEQSEKSAQEISSLIDSVQTTTKDASEAMRTGLVQLERGIQVIHHAGRAFEQILESSRFVATQNQEVSAATQEISAGTEEVTASILSVSGIAKETADNVQTIINASGSQLQAMAEISDAVETMLRSVEDMKETIASFRV